MRIPCKALLGLKLQHEAAKTSNRCPCSLGEELLGSLMGVTTRVGLWAGQEA